MQPPPRKRCEACDPASPFPCALCLAEEALAYRRAAIVLWISALFAGVLGFLSYVLSDHVRSMPGVVALRVLARVAGIVVVLRVLACVASIVVVLFYEVGVDLWRNGWRSTERKP